MTKTVTAIKTGNDLDTRRKRREGRPKTTWRRTVHKERKEEKSISWDEKRTIAVNWEKVR